MSITSIEWIFSNTGKRIARTLLVAGMSMICCGCSTSAMARQYVYHTFEVTADKDAINSTDFIYSYGAARVNRTHGKTTHPGVPFEIFSTRMIIPDTFAVQWETPDGIKRDATVPVRERLHESIDGKVIHFVIHRDHVEGFIGHYDRLGMHIERRFY